MNALKVVFPSTNHLLCRWHIKKNIPGFLKKNRLCASELELQTFMGDWSSLCLVQDQVSFMDAWTSLQSKYDTLPSALNYLEQWIAFKSMFVAAWTNGVLHFGSTTTSRVEGSHATLKKPLQVSNGSFQLVKDRISLFLNKNWKELRQGKQRGSSFKSWTFPSLKMSSGGIRTMLCSRPLISYKLSRIL